jgi:hypothetical protein
VNSVCTVDACEPGFGNCDGKAWNGCEAALTANDSCGACGVACGPYEQCEATSVKNIGACACEGPAFGDAPNCRGPGPIAVGSLWTCGIDSTDKLLCVGEQGTTIVTGINEAITYRQISISYELGEGCGVTTDGKINCWNDATVNAMINPASARFVQVVVGDTALCGLTVDHGAKCWTHHPKVADYGEARPPDEKFVQLAAGFFHFCGLHGDGTVSCWGAGSAERKIDCGADCGQAQPPSDQTFVQITAGRFHSCGLKADGTVRCWGVGVTYGATSKDGLDFSQAVPPSDPMTWISAGQYHTCGVLKADGSVVCWGAGQAGGTGDYDAGQSVAPRGQFLEVFAGWVHTCALDTNFHRVCWGQNNNGRAPATSTELYPLNPGF